MTQININSRLVTFAQQELVLGYQSSEREKIKATTNHLLQVLKVGLVPLISDIRIFGSYDRNTILPRKFDPESDIDILVIFNHDNLRTPETYRNNIKRVLTNSYSSSLIKKDFPTIRMELGHIMYDFVPSYKDQYSQRYHIPDKTWGWRQTEPNDVKDTLTYANKYSDQNMVRQTIRLVKHWNASKNRPFDSYELERDIANMSFYRYQNLYHSFLGAMDYKAGTLPGVRQALEMIRQYEGNHFREPNSSKQLEWLQKLLPGLT